MNRVKIAALTTSMMTPAERSKGRFMRAPEHPSGDDTGATGADSGATGDNTGGNSGESGNGGGAGDNTGQADDLEGFWDNKDEPPKPGESPDDQIQQQSQALGTELGGLIKAFKGPDVFTKEVADGIANGDLSGVNAALSAHATAMMNHNMVVTAKLVGAVIDRMQGDFDRKIEQALGNRDSTMALETHFPLAKDPRMRPMVQRVWDQALANSKGDKDKAIRMTRGMLEAFGSKTSIRQPAEDPTAGINTSASRSLVESLLQRDSG